VDPGKGARRFMHPADIQVQSHSKGRSQAQMEWILDAGGRVSVRGTPDAMYGAWNPRPKAQITILADSYQAKKVKCPNDLVYKSDGLAVLH